ncbi:MAG: response regulator [Acidobacteria bacterium]|nr:MAG: response regulator [Acidobacteriota bacterium]
MNAPARVLIVDDDEDTLTLYSFALSASGLAVDRATTGAAALAAARSRPPAVVVTDLTLPDVDGIQLCTALRAAVGPGLLGLIVLSGTSDAEQRARARQAGATDVLVKPCLPDDLERVIRRALASAESGG